MSPNEISIEEVPGYMTINTVKPKKDQQKPTQVHGSLHGTEILKLVKEIKQKKSMQKKRRSRRKKIN